MNKVKKHPLTMIGVAIINLFVLILAVITIWGALSKSESTSFTQNIENIQTLTDASADKIGIVLDNMSKHILSAADYINQNEMTVDEIYQYIHNCFSSSHAGENWQLAESALNGKTGNSKGYDAIALAGGDLSPFTYSLASYHDLAEILCLADNGETGIIRFSSEFTDASGGLEKVFAVTTPVKVKTENGSCFKTLMLLEKSEEVSKVIAASDNLNMMSYAGYSNVIIDHNAKYVISNSSFQGKDFVDYLLLYNPGLDADKANSIREHLKPGDYSDTLYLVNNRDINCVYTIVSIPDYMWSIVSATPIQSFHNIYDYSGTVFTIAVLFIILLLIDISVFLLINRRLKISTAEANEANESKSRFLSSMSHDIRTPMNAIIGMTIIAQKEMEKPQIDTTVMTDCIKSIEMSGNYMLSLINDILDMTKIESGKIELQPDIFSLTKMFNEMISICRQRADEKNQTVEVRCDVRHEVVFGDFVRINQIFMNILTNAIKYTEAGGCISVELNEVTIAENTEKARFVYVVTDNGIGMTDDFVKTIFDRFSRAVDSRVNTIQGTGLGMAIAKQLTDLMNGTIDVVSQPNVGSTFTVRIDLPIAGASALPETEKKANQSFAADGIEINTFPDMRVLVAEDNDTNWKVFNRILKYYGINADRANNGMAAVDIIQNSGIDYDLIFMDIQMPVLNGYGATSAIRALTDTRKSGIPIYAMTADTFSNDVQKCIDSGMNGHLAKPIDLDKVLNVIRNIYHKKNEGEHEYESEN